MSDLKYINVIIDQLDKLYPNISSFDKQELMKIITEVIEAETKYEFSDDRREIKKLIDSLMKWGKYVTFKENWS